MRMSLRGRLLAAFLFVGLISVAGAGWLVDRTVRREAYDQVAERLQYEVTMTGQMTASALFAPLGHDDTSLSDPIHDLADAVHTQLSVLTPDGFCVADSATPRGATAAPTSEAHEPEVAEALAHGRGSAVRGEGAERRLWVAETVVRDGKVLGIARAAVPLSVVDEAAHRVRVDVVQAALGALALAGLLGVLLSFEIARPVRKLAAAARRVGGGELSVRVDVPSGDELGDLGKALNEMTADLEAMMGKLNQRTADMRRVLDTVDQGLLVAGRDGKIEAERSARVDEWFQSPPAGTPVWELASEASQEAREACALAWEQLAEGILPFEVLLAQLPKQTEAGAHVYAWRYAPIVETAGAEPKRLLVSVSDISTTVQAAERESAHRDVLQLMTRFLRDRAGVVEFMHEADRIVADLQKTGDAKELARALHTLKGGSAMQGLEGLARSLHELESVLEQQGHLSKADRERFAARWKAFRTTVDAMLDARAGVVVDEREVQAVVDALEQGKPPKEIAKRVASWTRTPIETLLGGLGDRAHAIGAPLGKAPLAIHIDHDGTRVDRRRYAGLFMALSHAVRNAIAHGIEPKEERERKKKPATGQLTFRGRLEGDELVVEVVDDGAGIAWDAVANKLRELGRPVGTRAELEEGLFTHGVTTAGSLTEVSGRGVGLGALRQVVQELGGRVVVESEPGKGTTITCRIPESIQAPPAGRAVAR